MAKVVTLQNPTKRRAAESPATETVDLSLRMLERLASAREPIGVSDLAREFEASKATVYRHLQALLRHGFVRQESTTMRYTAGIKLFVLGERLRERFDLLTVAREELARLREQTGLTVTLSALVDSQVIYLEILQGDAIVNFAVQPGAVLDLHAFSHGQVALAFGPEDLMARCLARPLKALTPQTICSPIALRRVVAQIRARGWVTTPNQALQGMTGLAAPLFNHAGNFVGAVAIGGSIQHIPASPPQEQIRAVMKTAERISQKLGWGGR